LPQRSATRLSASSHVALGIFASRITGLARERAIGYYFGVDSIVADGAQSLIREQVEMGVAVRMAVLEALSRNLPNA